MGCICYGQESRWVSLQGEEGLFQQVTGQGRLAKDWLEGKTGKAVFAVVLSCLLRRDPILGTHIAFHSRGERFFLCNDPVFPTR